MKYFDIVVLHFDDFNKVHIFSNNDLTITVPEVLCILGATTGSHGVLRGKVELQGLQKIFQSFNSEEIHYNRCRFKDKLSIILFNFESISNGEYILSGAIRKLSFFIENEIKYGELNYKKQTVLMPADVSAYHNARKTKNKFLDYMKSIELIKHPIKHKHHDYYLVLSPQQSNILIELSKGHDYKAIYDKHKITPKTIEHYLTIIKAKTGYRTKIELVCAFRAANSWLGVTEYD